MEPLPEAYARLDAGHHVTLGTIDAAKAVAVALLWRHARRPLLLLVPRESDAEAYLEQLQAWTGGAARRFPARGGLPYAREASTDAVARRLATLSALAQAGFGAPPPLIVASVAAAAERTLAPADLSRGPGTIEPGTRLALDGFALRLVEAGYRVGALVEAPGQVARRGGLVDVFPPGADEPVRIEFAGAEVASIRGFDPLTQRTTGRVASVQIGPAVEWLPSRERLLLLAAHLEGAQDREVRGEIGALRAGELPAPARYGPLAADATLFDHLPPQAVLIVDEREAIAAAARDLDDLAAERRADLASHGELPADAPLPHAAQQELAVASDAHPRRADLQRWATGREPGALRLPFAVADAYGGRLPAAAADAERQLRRGDRVLVVTQQAQRFGEVLAEAGVAAPVAATLAAPPARGTLALVQGALPEGWHIADAPGVIALVTDRELFGFVKQRRQLRARTSHRSRFLAEVQPGDFVVHADHGIARFAGIVRRPVDGELRDYLELRYAAGDRLYVPVDQVDRVSRYVGPSDHAPRLTRLGTQEWARARARVREAVSIVASDLLRLYAARQLLPGHAFAPDGEWQHELEAAFPYEETADQREAIAAVKLDMETPRPMDRVICGDVGFGKTEVALRAAFKAVAEGYQVALLVPTTVLAQQHEQTFRERLAAFPVRVESLSRFRTDAEARDVLAALRDGEVDIVIGTHRLLSEDVQFRNLGLVIIDEEQRFGVAHKERLKRMRLEVDVLTLSATPIPRTLHMALTGIRDMSTMEDAPQGRQPVQTYVMEWDDAIVREAILHELERGGQTFVVHNRVQSIDVFAERLRALVPEARIVVGHGQQPETVLKRVVQRFAGGEFDVLICTTIIESGIDMPNVNTLVVDRAERLGLAQLYQLRGRIGRGSQQAYAYLLYPREHVLSEVAQQRLSAIFEASELGAGFQVALRDLEIRGAGNLLGAEQSGQIAAVGFDLYTKMLADAVESLRATHEGRPPEGAAPPAVAIDLPASAFIPEPYAAEIEVRLALYQRIATLASRREAELLAAEIADRLGPLPEPLAQLFALVRIRLAAVQAGVAAVRLDGNEVVLTATAQRPFTQRALPPLPAGVRTRQSQIRIDRAALGERWLDAIETLLRLLAGEGAAERVVAAARAR